MEKRGVCKVFVDIDAKDLRGFCINEPVRFPHRLFLLVSSQYFILCLQTIDNSNVTPDGEDDLAVGTHVSYPV